MMKRIRYSCLLIVIAFGCSSQTSIKDAQEFCAELKSYSKETDLTVFDVTSMNYSEITKDLYKSAEEFEIVKKSFPNEEVFFYSYLSNDNCSLIVLSKSFMNSPIIRLHFLNFSKEKDLIDRLLLSEKSIYPGGHSKTKSSYDDGILTITKLNGYVGDYVEDEDRYTSVVDSITMKYSFVDGFFKKDSMDSIRLVR